MGAKVAAGRSASQPPIPQQFDTGIDDDMNDAQAETNKIFEQINREVLEREKKQ